MASAAYYVAHLEDDSDEHRDEDQYSARHAKVTYLDGQGLQLLLKIRWLSHDLRLELDCSGHRVPTNGYNECLTEALGHQGLSEEAAVAVLSGLRYSFLDDAVALAGERALIADEVLALKHDAVSGDLHAHSHHEDIANYQIR